MPTRKFHDNDFFFDKFESRVDKLVEHPVRNFVLGWLAILAVNFIIWGAAIAGVLFFVKWLFF